jgi:hypothetical protein
MNLEQMDPTFARGLRAALVEEVRTVSPARRRRHRWWVGAGVFAGIGLAGGMGAATAGFFTEPGADIVTELEGPSPASYTGTQTIEIGPRPQEATHMEVRLTCLSAGTFYFPDGGFTTCTDVDKGTTSFGSFPLSDGQTAVEVRTDTSDASYRVEVSYENRTPTELAVNANGDTYGTSTTGLNPDLLSVIATNGRFGYAYTEELDEINGTTASRGFTSPEDALAWQESRRGKTFSIPVYESDGETVIGEFVIPGLPKLPDAP